MGKLTKAIIWTALFLVMLLAIDQLLVQVPPVHPAHKAVTSFYNDFRGRLIDLTFGGKKTSSQSIEAVIDKQQKGEKPVPAKKAEGTTVKQQIDQTAEENKTQRYIYSDGKGELHFVDSLEEVPDEYRAQAQPMSR